MKLNYNKLKLEIEESGTNLKDFSLEIGRSPSWFYNAMEQESLKVKDLEQICVKLNKPIWHFFDVDGYELAKSLTNTDSKKEILKEILEVNKQMLFELKSLNKT